MKLLMLASFLTIAFCYNDIQDVNYDIYSQNKQLLQEHLDCYIDKGPCAPVPKAVKTHLPEMFADACQNCNDIQKHHGRQFIQALKRFLPEGYQQFKNKYDTDGTRLDAFEAAVANY